jgi:hypothetical protein
MDALDDALRQVASVIHPRQPGPAISIGHRITLSATSSAFGQKAESYRRQLMADS